MTKFTYLKFSIEENVAYIRLNQPKTLNAMSVDMAAELETAIDHANEQARAIVLTGEGRGFCSGANLTSGTIDLNDPERDMGVRLERVYNPLLTKMKNSSIPIVTAIRGPAAGIGSSMALMGDIIVAGRSAFFLQAFCNIGLVPDGGAPYLLSRAIGRVRTMELVLLGERFPAEKAYEAGLITRLVDDEEVDDTAKELALKLASGPTKTIKLIRQLTWAAYDNPFEQQIAAERDTQKIAGRTDDFIEGISAFREKRKAKFQGK